jgi:hypothetical protein
MSEHEDNYLFDQLQRKIAIADRARDYQDRANAGYVRWQRYYRDWLDFPTDWEGEDEDNAWLAREQNKVSELYAIARANLIALLSLKKGLRP